MFVATNGFSLQRMSEMRHENTALRAKVALMEAEADVAVDTARANKHSEMISVLCARVKAYKTANDKLSAAAQKAVSDADAAQAQAIMASEAARDASAAAEREERGRVRAEEGRKGAEERAERAEEMLGRVREQLERADRAVGELESALEREVGRRREAEGSVERGKNEIMALQGQVAELQAMVAEKTAAYEALASGAEEQESTIATLFAANAANKRKADTLTAELEAYRSEFDTIMSTLGEL